MRMHPWLAGAQYWTTAVVPVYRLISLIGPHCPASTYSTCSSLSVCIWLLAQKERGGNGGGGEERDKLRALTVVGARQSVHYLRNICLVIKHNAVP